MNKLVSVVVVLLAVGGFSELPPEFCTGGADPTCYFPDPNKPDPLLDDHLFLYNNYNNNNKEKNIQNIQNDADGLLRERRDGTVTEDIEEGDDISSTLTPTSDTPQKKGDDDDEDFNIHIQPLDNQKDMSELHLKQYEPDTVINSYYPPWTYQGFFSPKYWDTIPAHYFSLKSTGKATNMSKLLESVQKKHESGKSFMEFGEKGTVSNCSTDFPSPIDILTKNAREETTFVKFNIMHFEQLYGFLMFLPEDGTDLLFVKLQTPLKQISKKPSIDKGSVIGSPLTLDRILIHYGSTPDQGSEHRINGKSYGMELQFMFTLQTEGKELTYYDVLYEYAVSKDSSLFGKNQLALCILVEVASPHEHAKDQVYNKGMKYLGMAAREFSWIQNTGKYRAFQVNKKVLSLQDFLAVPFAGHYYTYFGSLTHPPCFNNTRYSVFETPIRITHDNWRDFLFLPSEYSDTGFVADNYRPLETIKVWNNSTPPEKPEIVDYLTEEMIERISFTVAKSRFATFEDIKGEYDYVDEEFRKSSATNDHKYKSNHLLLLLVLLVTYNITL